jgi:hypothetical protein
MIPAAAQTLAGILAQDSALIRAEIIDFNHPQVQQPDRPVLNLYCYHLEMRSLESEAGVRSHEGMVRAIASPPIPSASIPSASIPDQVPISAQSPWFDLFFLISALDNTALGEQQLLSEALIQLLPYSCLPESQLVGSLQGHKSLPMRIAAEGLWDPVKLWTALGVPLRPAIHVMVTVPFFRHPWQLMSMSPTQSEVREPASCHSGPGPPTRLT